MAISSSTHQLCLVFLLLAVAGSGARDAAATYLDSAPPNRVTIITDSVGGVLSWVTQARENLARGLDLDLEAKSCRKLVDPGCPAPGEGDLHPKSALDTIRELGGQLGPTVVIDVGYNDIWNLYAAGIDKVMQALVAAGVPHVVWVTLEEVRDPWMSINEAIRAAPTRWKQLIVADWAAEASADKPWFSDGVHMNSEGGLRFADFLRPYVLEACGDPCAPPPPLEIATTWLPLARKGKPYSFRLSAQGGAPPLSWSVIGLPVGLHLSAVGRISGTPRSAGVSLLTFRLRDSWEEEATVELLLRVRRPA